MMRIKQQLSHSRRPHPIFPASYSSLCGSSNSTVVLFLSFLFFSFVLLLLLFNKATLNCGIASLRAAPITAPWSEPSSHWTGDLRRAPFAWNKLCFGPVKGTKLRLAAFSKKWPIGAVPGGMERHAYALYTTLARSGHEIHVFTSPSNASSRYVHQAIDGDLHMHLASNEHGALDGQVLWKIFTEWNATQPFDFVHTESVALHHVWAAAVPNLAATWHGIAYEVLHSDIFQDLLRKPDHDRPAQSTEHLRDVMPKLLDEIRFFPSYKHHIAISHSVGDVLTDIYQTPHENVHIIHNGIDEENFYHDTRVGKELRTELGVPPTARLVMGVAGRLVRDKGHGLLIEAFSLIRKRYPDVYLLVAGSGPYESQYRVLEPNVKVLGAMEPSKLARFYNALDVFVDPTLRPQGLDLTLMEAMHCGKPILASNFPSITRSVVLHRGFGHTFAPNVKAVTEAMESAVQAGPVKLAEKGMACKKYAVSLFTARKMASAYERFFFCMKDEKYCRYPLDSDCR